ncbi:MAG: hypothetical protein K6F75_07950 [Butyrivibrio sp.]|nr:hypothetical protein [Butyrivibrio sp.]
MVWAQSLAVIALSAALFLALISYLALDADNREKWSGIAFTVAILGGIFIYGSINAFVVGFSPVAILRTMIDIVRMFGGVNRVDDFSKLVDGAPGWILVFWVIHFFGYYALVSAVVTTLGKNAINRLRAWLFRIHDIELIYGTDDNAIEFGKKLATNKKVSVVYVSDSSSREADIRALGGMLYTDEIATKVRPKFLKRLSVKKGSGSIRLNALADDVDSNISYARMLLKTLEDCGIKPEQTKLVMLGREETQGEVFFNTSERYGYGSVKVFDRAELVARVLLQKYPLCNAITFDENYRATADAECLLVGFGHLGQEVLRKLVANGQFEGSNFHVKVFDSALDETNGLFKMRYQSMLDNYNIDFSSSDGRSISATEYVMEHAKSLKYIVVAVGDEKTGREIAYGFQEILRERGISMPIYQCLKDRVYCYRVGKERKKSAIYDADILYTGKMDQLAMEINHYYCGDDGSIDKQWAECDYFSRMSCRASADYLQTLFQRLGFIGKDLTIDGEKLENLAKSEHHRWCAFHFSMGYSTMSDEEKDKRAEMYKQDGKTRITKDPANKLHACLIPWDDLDELSDYENAITGRNVDYKQSDRDNIITVKKILMSGK